MNVCVSGTKSFLFTPNNKTIEKLRGFQNLPIGWNYGEGQPIEQQTIDMAVRVARLSYKLGYTSSDAFPGSMGEILIALYIGDHCVEVTLDADHVITVIHESTEQDDREYACDDFDSVREVLRAILSEICLPSFERFTPNILTQKEIDLFRWPLNHLPMNTEVEYPCLIRTVQSKPAAIYVVISKGTTHQPWPNQQFSGSLNQPNYQIPVQR